MLKVLRIDFRRARGKNFICLVFENESESDVKALGSLSGYKGQKLRGHNDIVVERKEGRSK